MEECGRRRDTKRNGNKRNHFHAKVWEVRAFSREFSEEREGLRPDWAEPHNRKKRIGSQPNCPVSDARKAARCRSTDGTHADGGASARDRSRFSACKRPRCQ